MGLARQPVPVRFQFIYVIHGDAGYTYYDRNGRRRRADLEALSQAETVARASPAAEVFIFHQKPVPFLGFFHGSDGMLYQYRGGERLRALAYSRPRDEGDLGAEAALFRQYASGPAAPAPTRVFLYFGHEIPVTAGVPYSRSRPDTAFSLASFARGLGGFAPRADPRAKPFSLFVLSACHGGTPAATRALAPYAAYLLASPGELHLSYLDARALARWAAETPRAGTDPERESPRDRDAETGAWGRAVAAESYARLDSNTSTAITLSLYETGKASDYLEARKEAWLKGIPAGSLRNAGDTSASGYGDCADNPGFGPGGETAGATVYYRAARFGPDKAREFRSGWECPTHAPDLLGQAP